MKTQYLVVERLSIGDLTQSTSHNIHFPGATLEYK